MPLTYDNVRDSLLLVGLAVVPTERHGVDREADLDLTPATTIADVVHVLAEQSAGTEAGPSVTGAL